MIFSYEHGMQTMDLSPGKNFDQKGLFDVKWSIPSKRLQKERKKKWKKFEWK